ncbi:glycosyltransferase family 2 protein [Mycetocola lacteus]|uniref:Glycosyltransferase family 2 protein n=1 Tax=Mycetocola lacteus TaxID=76637 RepID=A0A3L7AVW0_9MICO|nr:glycosyltransferase [Mycetocola lacteus]RLP80731.1 glycosyltransferase family 2 protein [Mycetocola lacteus]RLP84516.1 glycosyltransferase family 2 protein [Mycetocola lacteus]
MPSGGGSGTDRAGAGQPSVGVAILTQGRRPEELRRAIDSVLAQTGVHLDIVVVGNGYQPVDLPAGVRAHALATNEGIPAGRNRGAAQVSGEYIYFLDDDAWLPDTDYLSRAIGLIRADPSIGLVQPRMMDPESGETLRHWIPRAGSPDPSESGPAFSCMEASILLPRTVFDRTGGWAEPFFYAHEGIELAWRVWDQDLRAWYAGDLRAFHPVVQQTRHSQYYRLTARNRVWIARRNLPLPLGIAYVGIWTLATIARWWRKPEALKPWFGGWREGIRTPPGGRKRLRWRTIWRMTRAGRPPIY